ncbi:MAG: Rrf2 family transcriptional regulator [Verrucomicrobia bacterium]|nr:Rrf2 family transcriptional regulator [Verrucomicrobiota bacterium]
MLHFSKTAGYAIHALSCIGASVPQACFVRDIASRTGLQKPYLAKIIVQLVQSGLVRTKRGYRGGVVLARNPEEISLLEVVQAIEGAPSLGTCLFGLKECPARGHCPAHAHWNSTRKEIEETLRRTMLSAVMKVTPRRKSGGARLAEPF